MKESRISQFINIPIASKVKEKSKCTKQNTWIYKTDIVEDIGTYYI